MSLRRPLPEEHPAALSGYIALVPETDIRSALATQSAAVRAAFAPWVGSHERHRYAPNKWSVRELLTHLIDAERVFSYRLFCFSRREVAALPGFDENAYVEASRADEIPLSDQVDEFETSRRGSSALVDRLTDDELSLSGTANGKVVSVRALAYAMVGHPRHHLEVLRERYRLV